VIVTHGWLGSIIEQLKIIGRLTDPTAHGARADDAFDVVIPSLPGHGFSGTPTETGWGPIRIARVWAVLMERLGYTRYVAQGGDWGNAVTEQLALLTAPGLLGIHTNMASTVPDHIQSALDAGDPPPEDLADDEQYAWDQLADFYTRGLSYAQEMGDGRLIRAPVLGEQAPLLRAEGGHAADRGQRLPRRDPRRPATLGRAGLPELGPLQPSPEGWFDR
jgi:pimeloyl-ACP methyl ester carboxylesterase